MELHEIDMNLLVVFHELTKRRQVSAVADALGTSQSAISNSLNRLRKLFGDELFVRSGRGVAPTPFAQGMTESVADALGTLYDTLNRQRKFDPRTSTRRFTLAMTTIGEISFLPRLVDRLMAEAPGVVISTVRSNASLRDEMENGHVDLAIGNMPTLTTGFFQRGLSREQYVCLMRKGHPLLRRKDQKKLFAQAEHIEIVTSDTGHGVVTDVMNRAGIERKIRLQIPHFSSLAHILAATDLIATVPAAYARQTVQPFGLVTVDCPVRIPEILINVIWNGRYHRDPGNQWLRNTIFEEFGQQEKHEPD
ncbi:LysR family transcriptional regulator [Burkholderia cenocepacia]|nr:LysR family transcriptional regulator [Burkholderia cenocepacia]